MQTLHLESSSHFSSATKIAMNMIIFGKPVEHRHSREFEATPRASVLLLRQDLADAACAIGIRTLTDLLGCIDDRPAAIVKHLRGWSAEELQRSAETLRQSLRGIVADQILDFGQTRTCLHVSGTGSNSNFEH